MKNFKELALFHIVTLGVISFANPVFAQDINTVSDNIVESIDDLPGLLSGVSYLLGTLLGVLGVLKIKDHADNPGSTPLQHGMIRLAAGGALFALPLVFEAMQITIGEDGALEQAEVSGVAYGGGSCPGENAGHGYMQSHTVFQQAPRPLFRRVLPLRRVPWNLGYYETERSCRKPRTGPDMGLRQTLFGRRRFLRPSDRCGSRTKEP